MLNRIILIGRLTKDPEAKYTPSGVPVTSFRIAVDRPQSAEARQSGQPKEADFIDIVTWRQTAEFAANYLNKGRLVAVEGRLQIRDYMNNEGQKRIAPEVVADNVRPLDRREDNQGGGQGGFDNGDGGGYEQPQQQAPQQRAAAPAARSGGGGYDRGGGGNQGGGGGYERQPAAGGGNARGGAPAGGGRGLARNQPPPSNDGGDDFDDLTDPFAE
jgi:single-strand DNA-binding protein